MKDTNNDKSKLSRQRILGTNHSKSRSIISVCFKDEGRFASDSLFIFTTDGPEAFVKPTEASSGEKLLGRIRTFRAIAIM
jgi:hypothetical protein